MAARRVASEFEALLLRQLTSALNPSSDGEDGDALFGGDGGTSLSRQLFGEQLADTMAQNGGVGLADLITRQIQGGRVRQPGATQNVANTTLTKALRSVREDEPAVERPRPDGERVTLDGGGHVRPRRVHPLKAEAEAVAGHDHAHATQGTEPVELRMYVKGPLRSRFGGRIDPINGDRRFHAGVDIAAPRGTPIGAAAAGRVVFAGRDGGYGNTVVLEHADGTRTRYAHAERLTVGVGEAVADGETVALVGSTGHSTGPHLHFEVIRKGRHLNPLKFLTKDLTPTRR